MSVGSVPSSEGGYDRPTGTEHLEIQVREGRRAEVKCERGREVADGGGGRSFFFLVGVGFRSIRGYSGDHLCLSGVAGVA